jgi:Chaperone of endosialidase
MKPRTPPVLIIFALVCFALVQNTQAVSPPPDGGYPGGNTAEGQNALLSLTSGTYNTAVGFSSLKSNTTGNLNTAVGVNALSLNTTGVSNTANGVNALYSNTTGGENTANGVYALFSNTTGGGNAATGAFALFTNTVGLFNTGLGASTLQSNHTGISNTAAGYQALYVNDLSGTGLGSYNSAFGAFALTNNSDGEANSAFGTGAMEFNSTGQDNVAVGTDALLSNLTGTGNTAIGTDALESSTGSGNTALGFAAGLNVTTANNVICIGANVVGADVSNTAWIGAVYGVTTQNGTTAPVVVSADGQLGTVASSERFKKDIATMEQASEAILALRPITFHYKTDTAGTPQFGLIAEEVAKVNPALVLPDKDGKPYTVRYEAVNAMLLNEFLKEHRKVQELEANAARQQKQIEALSVGLQKVTAQLSASKPAPQVANNP